MTVDFDNGFIELDGRASDFDNGGALICPFCDMEYLHQGRVEIYSRDDEDAPSCMISIEPDGGVEKRPADATWSILNPSERRQGLFICFECEGCSNAPKLAIFQHKGQTFFRWDFPNV